jgi:hypothetical protein
MKSWLIPGLIMAGIALIVTALVIPSRSIDTLGKKVIAVVIDFEGISTVEGLDQTDTANIQKKTKIKNLDVVKTKAQSEASIELSTIKAEIRVLENSHILFEENTEGSVILTIKEGDLIVESLGNKADEQGPGAHFWIKKDGRQLSAVDYAITNEKNMQSSPLQKSKFASQIKQSDVLSQSKIEEILISKKNDFFRCYGQLIQKEEQAHGQLLLSFEILPTGKVASVDVAKTDINQPAFLSCLKEVVMRTKFPPFDGKTITTVFPLKFD